ncbi:MAG: preprotein translocase subunit SecE [Acidobacteriota bacterium]|nr:preprotein translocase subunit SecE [Acidobacteriota bacterium]MDQ7086618.1 preprotein translocase subunit SecE [Acidobacteriota bacterium]
MAGGIGKARGFVDDVWKELKRTSWPSKQEVYGTTLVVIVATIIVAVYLGLVDLVLATLQKLVLFS